MIINFDDNIINFKQKLEEINRKRNTGSENGKSVSNSPPKGEKREIVDLIKIKNENWLAAKIDIQDVDEAFQMVGELKNIFEQDVEKALNAHKNANPDKVLRLYPFE